MSPGELAVLKTSLGDMVLEFWPDVAPGHVENFKKLAKQGFYDGTCFHRVIKGFMIQGGDPLTKDPSQEALWGTGGPGHRIEAEFNDRRHERGVVSMARSNDPDSAGSQFLICHRDSRFLDGQYTAFGKLIKGDDVLEKIASTPTRPGDRPVTRVNVESIKIVSVDLTNEKHNGLENKQSAAEQRNFQTKRPFPKNPNIPFCHICGKYVQPRIVAVSKPIGAYTVHTGLPISPTVITSRDEVQKYCPDCGNRVFSVEDQNRERIESESLQSRERFGWFIVAVILLALIIEIIALIANHAR